MKLLLENWREHLKEELLTEFARSDKEALMAEQDRFTISYEIELESRGVAGESSAGRAEFAGNYLSEDYFGDSWSGREVGDFYLHYLDEEDPEPRDLIVKYLIEEYPTRVDPKSEDAENLISLSIAIKENEKIAKEFSTLYKNILRDGTRENKALIDAINNDPDIKEALKERGVEFKTAQQGTLPFGDEAKEEAVILGIQPGVLKEVVHTYLFNPEDDNFFGGAGVDKTIGLTDFLYNAGWEEEAEQWIEEGFDEIKNYVINGANPRWPTIADVTFFNTNNWESYHLKAIANMVASASQSFIDERTEADWREYQDDPVEYLDNNFGGDWEDHYEPTSEDGDLYEMLEEHFPRFMEKWADQLKFEPDGSLRNGIEFSMDNPKFMTGLDTAFEFLKDFFFDYNRQDNFHFDSNTGLHTNIGYLDDDGESHKEYNLMKALLFLNHDFAFKEFGQRKGTTWATDLKSDIAGKIGDEFRKDRSRFRELALKLYKEDKLDELGKELSRFVDNYAPSNAKSLGFNIRYINRLGYVEFRYPGGKQPTLEKMKKATLYYAYVIKQAVDPTYKKKEYEQKLVKLMTNLASHVDRPMEVKKIKEFMKKGEIYLMPETQPDLFGLKEYMKYILDRSLPYAQFMKTAAFFKGIRKGKTLKDTVAVFKVVVGPNRSVVFGAREEMKKKENYRIEEATIPIPQLERMIVNKSLTFVNSEHIEKRVKDVFEALAGGPLTATGALQENKIKIRLIKK